MGATMEALAKKHKCNTPQEEDPGEDTDERLAMGNEERPHTPEVDCSPDVFINDMDILRYIKQMLETPCVFPRPSGFDQPIDEERRGSGFVLHSTLKLLIRCLFDAFECKYRVVTPRLVMQEEQAHKFLHQLLAWYGNKGKDSKGEERILTIFSCSTKDGTAMANTPGIWDDAFFRQYCRFGQKIYVHILAGLGLSTHNTFYQGGDARMFVGVALVLPEQIYTHVQNWDKKQGHIHVNNACYSALHDASVCGYFLPLMTYKLEERKHTLP